MAASTSTVRVKLLFDNISNFAVNSHDRCWYMVDCKRLNTIDDFCKEISSRFGCDSDFQINLFIDGYLLPPWESVKLIRENDDISVHSSPHITTDDGTEEEKFPQAPPKKRKKKKYSELDTQELLAKFVSPTVSSVLSPASLVIETAPIESQTDTNGNLEDARRQAKVETSNMDEGTYKKKKSKKRQRSPSPLPEDQLPTSESVVKALVLTQENLNESSGCDDMEEVPMKQKAAVECPSPKEMVTVIADVSEIQTPEDGNGDKKRNRRRVRNRKNRKNKDANTSYEAKTSTPFTMTPPVSEDHRRHRDYKNQGLAKFPTKGYKVYDVKSTDTKHVKFESGSENEEELDLSSSFHVEQKTEQELLDSVKGKSTNNIEMQGSCVQPNSERKASHNAMRTNMPRETKNKENFTSQQQKSDSNSVRTFQKGPYANVKVFDRKKNKNVKYMVITKEEQLNTVASNESQIYQNTEVINVSEGSDSATDKSKGNNTPLVTEEVIAEVQPAKDYTKFALLHGPPRQGDLIAYKILEMTRNYTPEISSYKEAQVLGFDPITKSIQLELLNKQKQSRDGRFDLTVEYDEEILTNMTSDTKVTVTWTSLIEPRLLTK